MSFSESSGIITQTGTDTDLTGLVGVAGVTTTVSGGRSVYQITNKQLRIDGTLTQDPELEEMFFEGYGNVIALEVRSGGVYNIGQEISAGAEKNRFSSGTAIRFTRAQDSSFSEASSDISIAVGGVINWYGGAVFSNRIFALYGILNTFSKNAKWIGQHPGATSIRVRSADVLVDGFTTQTVSFTIIVIPTTPIKNWESYAGSDQKVVGISSGAPSNTFITFEGIDARGCVDFAVPYWKNKWGRSIDSYDGSNIFIKGNSGDSSDNTGLWEIRQRLDLEYSDLDGVSLDGVKALIVDTDNGNRIASNVIDSNVDYLADRTYAGTSSSGKITLDTDGGVLVALGWRTVGGLTGDNNEWDYRSESGDTTDDFTCFSIDYTKAINQTSLILKGSNGISRSVVMLPDNSITNSDKSAVDAYTIINAIATDGYDSIKSELVDNYLSESATIAGRSGVQLLIGSRDLYLNKTASSVRAYDGTTITLKTDEATQGASGTGDVYVQNGALLNGGTFNCDVNIDNNSEADTYTNVNIDKLIHTGTGTRTLTLDGGTITELEVTGGADLTVSLLNGATVTTTTETSGTITVSQDVIISDAMIIDGSRVQLWNVTKDAELDNSLVSGGGGYSLTINLGGSSIDDGDTIRIRTTYQSGVTAKLGAEALGIVTSTGLSFLLEQQDDEIYNTIGLDGSSITKFTADYVNDEVDIVTASDFLGTELYARFVYFETTEDGIRQFFGGFMAVDIANYLNDVSVLDLYINNNTATNLKQTDNVRLYKSNGVYPVRNPTAGGGGVDVVWRSQVYVAETGVSGLTASESSKLLSLDTGDVTINTADKAVLVDAVWDEVIDNQNHNTAKSAGKRLRQAGTSLAVEGSVDDGSPTTASFITDLTQIESSFYADQTCIFVSGDLEGQARIITSYNSGTKVLTFDEPWTIAPSDTDEFEIKADHVHPVSQIQENLDTLTNIKPSIPI